MVRRQSSSLSPSSSPCLSSGNHSRRLFQKTGCRGCHVSRSHIAFIGGGWCCLALLGLYFRSNRADQECLHLLAIRLASFGSKNSRIRRDDQMNFLFPIKTRQLFCPFAILPVISVVQYFMILSSSVTLCCKTVPECFQFLYFRGQSSLTTKPM